MYQSRTSYFLMSLFVLIQTSALAFATVDVENVTFGFNDGYKTGTWAPVDITVRSQNEPFIGELVIEVRNFFSDARIQRYATPLKLGATERQSRRFYVYCPKIATKLVILAAPIPRGKHHCLPRANRNITADTDSSQGLFRASVGTEW